MENTNRNWKTYVEQIVLSFDSIEYKIDFEEEDYSQINMRDKNGLFSCELYLTSYYDELHDVSISYKYQNKELGFNRHFEGSLLNYDTENNLSDLLAPFLIDGWWIKKYIFVFWYKTKMKDKDKNQIIGPITFHGFGLLIWILSLFDILAYRKWEYIEPLKYEITGANTA